MLTIRLLVIGGGGFIGQHVTVHALNLGWEVTSLGLTERRFSGVKCMVADIANFEVLRQTLRETRFDYVVNCGGYIDHAQFKSGGRRLIDTHFSGLLNLVELLDRSSLKRFVNIGSSDEYGAVAEPQSEWAREAPISPYSLAKVAAVHFLQMMYRTESFPAVTLRLFLTYGPGQDKSRLIPQIIHGCLENRSFPVSGGDQLRDFCYVEDTVRAIFATLRTSAADGQIVNLGSGFGVSIRSVVERVCDIIGGGVPQFGVLPYRPCENMALYADVTQAAKLLCWSPRVDLETGLKLTIDACRKTTWRSNRSC